MTHDIVMYCVDEAGDSVLWTRRGKLLVGEEGCSRFFIMGLAEIRDLESLRLDLSKLRESLLNDPYFRDVPSMRPGEGKTALCFHAKDDLPEVRREMFALLLKHDIAFHGVVRDKLVAADIVSRFRQIHPDYGYKQEQLYDDLVRRLLRDKLHGGLDYSITFARRGASDRTQALKQALEKGREQWCEYCGVERRPRPTIKVSTQHIHEHAGLQAVDYFLWALQRCYEKKEDRFIRLVWPKVECVWECDRNKDDRGIRYTKEKPLLAAELGI